MGPTPGPSTGYPLCHQDGHVIDSVGAPLTFLPWPRKPLLRFWLLLELGCAGLLWPLFLLRLFLSLRPGRVWGLRSLVGQSMPMGHIGLHLRRWHGRLGRV